MLAYESKAPVPRERSWRRVVALIAACVACGVGLLLWAWTAPGLWELLTFKPRGPIRPMGFVTMLVVSTLGGFLICFIFSAIAASVSNRPVAQRMAVLGILAGCLPGLNFLLFFVIVFARGIKLGD